MHAHVCMMVDQVVVTTLSCGCDNLVTTWSRDIHRQSPTGNYTVVSLLGR